MSLVPVDQPVEASLAEALEAPASAGLDKVCDVLVLYTGGTIGMKDTPHGYEPEPGFLSEFVYSMRAFQDPLLPRGYSPMSRFGRRVHFEIKEYDTLLDSSNMNMRDWEHIARDISENYDKYDAFVILHGTDTMAYTASALAFMFENLSKTVVITGSQVPLSVPQSDGVDNLLGALMIAGHYSVPEVGLYFNHRLYRGCRTRKVNTTDYDAFDSPNMVPLVRVGVEVVVAWDSVFFNNRVDRSESFRLRCNLEPHVACVRLFPGISATLLRHMLAPPLKGLVLETFGAGNAPSTNEELMSVLHEATSRGVVVVNITQCMHGSVKAGTYATGTALLRVGVTPGADLTSEAALTKLSYLLGRYGDPTIVREQLQRDLRGELTMPREKTFSFIQKSFVRSVAQVMHTHDYAGIRDALLPVLMCSAAQRGDLRDLTDLTQDSNDVNAADYDRRTPLHLASSEGHVECVNMLLTSGADANPVDRWGNSPMFDAFAKGHRSVIAILVSNGGLLINNNIPALLCRAGASSLDELRLLRECGVDMNLSDYDGRTALHLAASRGMLDSVKYLIEECNIDPRVTDNHKHTPLDDARIANELPVVAYIESRLQQL